MLTGREEEFFPPWNPLHHLFLPHREILELVRLEAWPQGDGTIRKGGVTDSLT